METLVQWIVGLILVPLYNWIKRGLGLADKAAAWVLLGFCLLIAFPLALLSGALSGVALDPANPGAFLEAVVRAFLVVLGTAEGLYMLVKKRG